MRVVALFVCAYEVEPNQSPAVTTSVVVPIRRIDPGFENRVVMFKSYILCRVAALLAAVWLALYASH